MLVVGYVMGLRSERRLCQEVHLNLAYRWFCRLRLEDKMPDSSIFSNLRRGKFRDRDIFAVSFGVWWPRASPVVWWAAQAAPTDTDHGIIMDVEATRSARQAEVGSTLTMLGRTAERFSIRPDWLVADPAYGSEDNLVEIVLKRQILPFIPVIEKGERTDGTLSRSDFIWDEENDRYICPEGKDLRHRRWNYSNPKMP